jgi:polyhydroxybutyrate depolymerase
VQAQGRARTGRRARLLAGLVLALGTPAATAAEGSDGCGAPPPEPALRTVQGEGRTRELILALPDDYDPDVRHDLVLAFHGRTNPAERVRAYYGLEDQAARPSIFVYPRGLPAGAGARGWWEPGEPGDRLRDYALFDALVETLSTHYCIDPARIFAVGHSLGASFVNSLACARGDVLRGVATVAGGMERSACRGRTAALLVHHPDDRLVPFALGEAARDRLLRANGLGDQAPVPLRSLPVPAGFTCMRWGGLGRQPGGLVPAPG